MNKLAISDALINRAHAKSDMLWDWHHNEIVKAIDSIKNIPDTSEQSAAWKKFDSSPLVKEHKRLVDKYRQHSFDLDVKMHRTLLNGGIAAAKERKQIQHAAKIKKLSVIGGGVIGAGVGGYVGHKLTKDPEHHKRNIAIGTGTGAVAGTGIGLLAHYLINRSKQ